MQTDKMMKAILLLTFTVLVSSSPVQPGNTAPLKQSYRRTLLKELIDELDKVLNFSKDTQGNVPNVFLTELKACEHKSFCQYEEELIKEVSGVSGAEYDPFRTDKLLMRNLHMFNEHHVKTCKRAEGPVKIHLQAFLKDLLHCAKREFTTSK
ncbi:interleukin-13 [Puntigrus tetrazona]|uniref:interleukin-13 n=1 Tax=Puntigrus tetrazona TaxID=1606681 RepID=UPI001C892D62|nr:interleukin-13 [Puntigrus tetrazona]